MMTLWENDDDALGMIQRHTVAHHSYKDRSLLGIMVYMFSKLSWEIYTVHLQGWCTLGQRDEEILLDITNF